MHQLPPAEHEVDEALARALLADQHPDLADLPIRPLAHGWDNVMFRLGEDLALRLPRRAVGAELIVTEQRWLPELAPRLPVEVPAPVRVGRPGRGYPWPWSLTPWIAGQPVGSVPLRADQAPRLGGFLKALHHAAPADAPHNPYRSIRLAERAEANATLARVAAARPDLVTEAVKAAWRDGLTAEIDLPLTWIHGDLHALNVLSDGGVLSGVIDWGDMARGDPATDLCGLWMLTPDAVARSAALEAYGGVSDATLRRARGWAVSLGVILVEAGLNNDPSHLAMGERTLRALAEDS